MQIKSLLLVLTAAALAQSAAIPQTSEIEVVEFDVRGSVADTTDLAVDLIDETNLPSTRGNVVDTTDLATDILPEDHVPSYLLANSLQARQTASLNAATDRLLFTNTLAQFLAAKSKQDPAGLNWTDDGCSSSPDKPLGFNFLHSCMRHDFGYRNYKAQERFTESNRERIDNNFKADLLAECAKADSSLEETACKALANTYFTAVRAVGWI
ncbi:prokaryotic phospholipase A2-domain-containing protein [Peziza echinospora]|nr:prokaryotic phospholipase A2-domain-containing protein [Peziza echinospora]